MRRTRANPRPDEHLPSESRKAKHSAAMLQYDKRLVERDIYGARKIKHTAMNLVVIIARTHMMNNPNLRIVNELRSFLASLKRKREFPIYLGSFSSQIGLEADFSQKIAAKQKV